MADKKATDGSNTGPPTEFQVTLAEFLTEIPKAQAETKAGFTSLCKSESIIGKKLRQEWKDLLALYMSKPTKVSWADWQQTSKGGA